MARSMRLENIVAQMIEAGHIHPAMSRDAIAAVYARVCERERVPQWDSQAKAWEPWDVARPWGSGPNESKPDFIEETARQLWGVVDIAPGDWPEEFPVVERELAADIGCHPGSLDDALWLRSQPEVWKHYLAIIKDRLPESEYHFRDLQFFVRVVREIGVTRVLRYPHAKTWALVRQFVCKHGVSIRLADAWPFQRQRSLPRQDATEKPCCERRAQKGVLHPELPLSSTLYHDFRRAGMLNRVMRAPPAPIPCASLLESRLMRGDS